jgi:hypothetical protein
MMMSVRGIRRMMMTTRRRKTGMIRRWLGKKRRRRIEVIAFCGYNLKVTFIGE